MWQNNDVLYNKIYIFNKRFPDFCYENIFDFCKNHGILVAPYTSRNTELTDISEDGFTFFENGQYTIFYNRDKPSQRVRFTVAHELGHIFLNHHKYVKASMLKYSDNSSPLWERQANIFARNILLPQNVAYFLKCYSHEEIAKVMGLSVQMVDLRYKFLRQDYFYLKRQKFLTKNKNVSLERGF